MKLDIGGQIFETRMSTLERAIKLTTIIRNEKKSSETSVSSEPIFIDRDPVYFPHVLKYLREGKVKLTLSTVDIERIREDAEFYGVESLAELMRAEESLRAPFFAGEQVVWRDPNIRRLCSDIGIHFDGSTEKLPLCLNAFREIDGMYEHNCPWCRVSREVVENNCIFDYPYQHTHCAGTVIKAYGDSCCYDVLFGSCPVFHVRGDMLRLEKERET